MDWAASKLAGISQELEQLRNRELHRLIEMLDSDPERGLRHALPLDGPLGRGRLAPGAKLGARDTRFDLARVGGGGGRDHWDVPAEIRRRLLARYRVLALREQRLGRFQRAAYIHAELLGDLSAAATVLKEGRFFAEAAALYRDHLHQPRAAAECFVAGGFFTEAIAIFEKERAFLELGDLHRWLENEPAAEIAFRKAVEVKVGALDFTAAAVLLEERLRAPDEALALLGNGWPDSPQAALCLAAEFTLLGHLGRTRPCETDSARFRKRLGKGPRRSHWLR
jgi:tetratricopeptide (TPR) repeat protein